MKDKQLIHIKEINSDKQPLWPVPQPITKRKTTDPLAISQDHFTYTFIMNSEILSVHFDKMRREIFLKGHNLKHLELKSNEIEALREVTQILESNEKGKEFSEDYLATLEGLLADKE